MTLPNLRRLFVPATLVGTDLQVFSTLTTLESLDLSDAYGHGRRYVGVADLAKLKNLRRLRLPGGELGDEFLKDIKALVGLEELDVRWNNKITDAGLAAISGLVNLKTLAIGSGDGITDAGVAALSRLVNLRVLDLPSGDHVTDAGIAQLKALRELRFLQLGEAGPSGLKALKDLPRLDHLAVDAVKVVPGRVDLSAMEGVTWLEIGHFVGKAGPRHRLPAGLQRLDIACLTAENLDFRSSAHIAQVQVCLDRSLFGENEACNLEWLSSLPELRELTLARPIKSDVMAIAGLTSLRALKIDGSGCVPPLGDEGMRALANLGDLESLAVEDYYGGGRKNLEVNSGMDVLPKLTKLRRLDLRGMPAVTSKTLANIWELKHLWRWTSILLAIASTHHLTTLRRTSWH